jgi:hypothetical protein
MTNLLKIVKNAAPDGGGSQAERTPRMDMSAGTLDICGPQIGFSWI